MKRLIKLISLLIVLFVGVSLLTGCYEWTTETEGKITGGGWFIDEYLQTKCNFGFNAHGLLVEDGEGCDPDVYEFKGQFQFNDKAGTKLHAEVEGLFKVYKCLGLLCDLQGYEFDGLTKDGTPVSVRVNEEGTAIQIMYDGYLWEGELQGGNITIH